MNYIPLLIVAIVLIILYFWYAGLITKRNKVREALSTIDVQLKQRLDLIPNILTIARKFMEHEQSLMKEITTLRTQAQNSYNNDNQDSIRKHLTAVDQLAARMGELIVSVENYPILKSDQTMVQAMQSYNEIEANIAAARRFYNSAVTALNNSIQIFPGNVIASLAGVKEMPFFEAEKAVHNAIDANRFLG